MVSPRVVVTGMGAVSSLGLGVGALWEGCLSGADTTQPIPPGWDCYYQAASRRWSPLPALDYKNLGFSRHQVLSLGVTSLIAIAAAREAWSDALLAPPSEFMNPWRSGVYLGTGLGGAQAPFDNYRAHLNAKLRNRLKDALNESPHDPLLVEHLAGLQAHPRVHPLVICQTMPNAAAAAVSIEFGLHGAAETLCFACASGTVAIGRAYEAIRRGELDLALAGGAEHLRDGAGGVFMGFDRLQTLARPTVTGEPENRPFDRHRSGFLFSEGGAGVMVLESLEHATRRGAPILAEVRAFAVNADAHSMVALAEDGAAISALYARVLSEARLSAGSIDYINSHGTGTELNDSIESTQIQRQFGARPLINSTKSILGHSIGASGALEAIITVSSLRHQKVHISCNLDDPIADLNFCRESRAATIANALSQSFGFGGHNAAIVLARAPSEL